MRRLVHFALAALALLIGGCGIQTTRAGRSSEHSARVRAFLVGQPIQPRPAEVMGVAGTAQVRVDDPAHPEAPATLITLGSSVPRERRDVCFGDYTANENPEDGDVACQVRGRAPFVLTLSHQDIPNVSGQFTVVWGQADRDVASVELTGAGASTTVLPLSAQRLFLVAFSPSARGAFRLVARLAGRSVGHSFKLPLTGGEFGSWPHVSQRGAISNSAPIGENIVTYSYRKVIRLLGPPLRTIDRPDRVRCIYYAVIGYQNGWLFCFRAQTMIGASGNHPPP